MMGFKQKQLTVAEKIKLLGYFEKEKMSERAFTGKFGIERIQVTDLIKS